MAIDKERVDMDKRTEIVNEYPKKAPKRLRGSEDVYLNRTMAAKEKCDIITTQIVRRFVFTKSSFAVSIFESGKFKEYKP